MNDEAKVVRCPHTNKLKLHALGPDCSSVGTSSSLGTSPRHQAANLRAQLNSANLVNAVIRHTTWSLDGEHATTLAHAARAGAK